MTDFQENNYGLQIKTINGYEDFMGVRKTKHEGYIRLKFEDKDCKAYTLECSVDHPIFNDKMELVLAKNIEIYDEIPCNNGETIILVEREYIKGDVYLYDIINSGKDHCYFSNGILSHNCEFLGSDGTLISPETLERLQFSNPVQESENGEFRIYQEPIPNHKYVAITDPAGGLEQDYSVCNVIDITSIPYKQVAIYRSNIIDPMLLPYKIVPICQKYNEALLLIEANNDVGGQVCYITWQELEYEGTLLTSSDDRGLQIKVGGTGAKPGVRTTSKVKGLGCANLKTLLENDKLEVCDSVVIEELSTFVAKGASFAAAEDCHDDTTMTLVLFAWLVKQPFFIDYTNTDVNKSVYDSKLDYLYDELLPIAFIANAGSEYTGNETLYDITDEYTGIRMIEGSPAGFEEWMNN